MMMTRCDTIVQCPHGEDEEGCHISETARLVMSLFLYDICIDVFMATYLIIINIIITIIITAGIAVLLTIITFFSTPILTKIFGDGSLEVQEQ